MVPTRTGGTDRDWRDGGSGGSGVEVAESLINDGDVAGFDTGLNDGHVAADDGGLLGRDGLRVGAFVFGGREFEFFEDDLIGAGACFGGGRRGGFGRQRGFGGSGATGFDGGQIFRGAARRFG